MGFFGINFKNFFALILFLLEKGLAIGLACLIVILGKRMFSQDDEGNAFVYLIGIIFCIIAIFFLIIANPVKDHGYNIMAE